MIPETSLLQQTTGAAQRALYPSLRDRRVIVTGGSSGLGAGLGEAFVARGWRVAVVDILVAEGEWLAE